MVNPDRELRKLVAAIVAHDSAAVDGFITASPQLATESFPEGATRAEAKANFVEAIRRNIYAGDTALHFAAASYQPEMVQKLIAAGADLRARNRRKDEPLHAASCGSPGSHFWNPAAQAATIVCLVESGADPNAINMDGATPLHKAVRTRSAIAVRTLLDCGADPRQKNKSGSTPMLLAQYHTGKSGSGSPEAKAQQQEIVRILDATLKAV
jgi:Ankyrin repeats (many copies)/Ankyrin repeat